jgi:hypothetical protein
VQPFGIILAIILFAVYLFRVRRLRGLYRQAIGATNKGRGYIYVFRGRYGHFFWVKIGRANNVYRRMKEHRTSASPFGVEIIAVIKVRNDKAAEAYIQDLFDFEHLKTETNGDEWYWYSPRMMEYFHIVKDKRLTRQVRSYF